ncbi:MAG TPA: formate dehydrogenase subunit gamma [Burkholderiaceae bacterium]|nr:formate dehydrogenase subunit gamma [Burkholderiaceae bacterium]
MSSNVPDTPADAPAPDPATLAAVHSALARHRNAEGNLLPILHDIQDTLGYIPPSCVPVLAEEINRSRAEIHGVISFYAHFRQTPPAPIKLEICRAEACQSMGANALAAHAQHTLGCGFKETSTDQRVNLEPVYCLGLCAQSPAIAVNGRPHAHMTPERLDALLASEASSNSTEAMP